MFAFVCSPPTELHFYEVNQAAELMADGEETPASGRSIQRELDPRPPREHKLSRTAAAAAAFCTPLGRFKVLHFPPIFLDVVQPL